MADFEALDEAEALALRRYEIAARQRRRFKLLRLSARSTLRLTAAFGRGLDPRRSHDARGLGLLTARAARAYERMARLNGAVIYTHRVAVRTLRATGIQLRP